MTDFERIKLLINHFRLRSLNAFAKRTGAHIDTIRNILDGKVKFTKETANRISNNLYTIRYDWILKDEVKWLKWQIELKDEQIKHCLNRGERSSNQTKKV